MSNSGVEVNKNINKLIDLVHSYGIKVGLSIKPDTDIKKLEPYLEKIDLILVMSVEPGKGGQKFIEKTTDRIIELKKLLEEKNIHDILISVDGGINEDTKDKVSMVDILVSGNYITSSKNFQENIGKLRGGIKHEEK